MQKLPLSYLKCSHYGFILQKEIGFLSEKIFGNHILNLCEILNNKICGLEFFIVETCLALKSMMTLLLYTNRGSDPTQNKS